MSVGNPPSPTDTRAPDYDPASIHALVHAFYGRVQTDPEIGPVFAQRIADWGPHLDRMVAFWRTILRGEALYTPDARGGPPVLHRMIDELSLDHFDRWLTLFEETAGEIFQERAAEVLVGRARQIGRVLSIHLSPLDGSPGSDQPA